MHLIRRFFSDNLLYICWETENLNLESKVQSSRSHGRFWFTNYVVLRASTECLTPPKCSKSFRVQLWEQEGNKKEASMLISSNAYYEGQLQWCAKRHQKGYTDVSQTRMQDSAFNVESQRIYSCCCIAIFNEWSRKDHSARQNLLEGTEILDFWKIRRRVHKCFLKRISPPQPSLSEETKEFKEEQTVWNRFSGILELAKMDLPIRSWAIRTHVC